MVRSVEEIVQHMARSTGGVIRHRAGRQKAGKVEAMATQPGTIALPRILDLRIAQKSNRSQGTTSHALMLARVGAKITFGATPLTAGTTAVLKLRSLSSHVMGGPALAFVTIWESRTSGAQSLTRATATVGGIIVVRIRRKVNQPGRVGSLPS